MKCIKVLADKKGMDTGWTVTIREMSSPDKEVFIKKGSPIDLELFTFQQARLFCDHLDFLMKGYLDTEEDKKIHNPAMLDINAAIISLEACLDKCQNKILQFIDGSINDE